MQPVVCTGPPPIGLSLPIMACLLPASAPQSPSPQQKTALRVPVGLHLHTQLALPPEGWVRFFRGLGYVLHGFGPGYAGFKASWWDGKPKSQVFWQRGPQPPSTVTSPQPRQILLLLPRIYPLPPWILLVKSPLNA